MRDVGEFVNRSLPIEEKACLSKARFVGSREARNVARRGRRQDGSTEPYRCDWCGSWHLGHRRRRHRSHRASHRGCGRVVLGGCVIDGSEATHACPVCGQLFYERPDDDDEEVGAFLSYELMDDR